jgi:hypothetical protein
MCATPAYQLSTKLAISLRRSDRTGCWVPPGVYHARLPVNDQSIEQSFEIVADPHLDTARVRDLPSQLELSRDIYARLSACNVLINRISQLEDQVGERACVGGHRPRPIAVLMCWSRSRRSRRASST